MALLVALAARYEAEQEEMEQAVEEMRDTLDSFDDQSVYENFPYITIDG